jgi:hypothetical protein
MNVVMVKVDPTDTPTQGGSDRNPATNPLDPVYIYLRYLEDHMQNACEPHLDLY